uniref:Uncharacterized protein n=1 Tax=Utricularia reniformis TaxID=192314 RepID=A0A1Y0B437_9LAMI|nr:hypothetical protein AEK19_MT1990 [Utricularia reniformis]ART32153.1 hypothetical protein AEK19_MT1990 [Utricularia reniformis]
MRAKLVPRRASPSINKPNGDNTFLNQLILLISRINNEVSIFGSSNHPSYLNSISRKASIWIFYIAR